MGRIDCLVRPDRLLLLPHPDWPLDDEARGDLPPAPGRYAPGAGEDRSPHQEEFPMSAAPRIESSLAAAAESAPAWTDRHASALATRAAQARQVSGRRRLIDPTTCDRDYEAAEVEFMLAMQEYKRRSGRMFPTWSEVLEVLKSLGHRKDALEMAIVTADGLQGD
jgi:hypothetical protein